MYRPRRIRIPMGGSRPARPEEMAPVQGPPAPAPGVFLSCGRHSRCTLCSRTVRLVIDREPVSRPTRWEQCDRCRLGVEVIL